MDTIEAQLRQSLTAALTAKFGDLSTASPSVRTVRHFVARWLYKHGAAGSGRVVGIRRFHVTKRRRTGRIDIRFHGARETVSAAQWCAEAA